MDPKLLQQIEMASMLVKLGLSTAEKIRDLFRSEGHDDELLANIMDQVDQRIARRS